ncbi:MAG: hypothetical protein AAF384_12305 [Pseudomonadota bacterium]
MKFRQRTLTFLIVGLAANNVVSADELPSPPAAVSQHSATQIADEWANNCLWSEENDASDENFDVVAADVAAEEVLLARRGEEIERLKGALAAKQKTLEDKASEIDRLRATLDSAVARGFSSQAERGAHNQLIESFNAKIKSYNALGAEVEEQQVTLQRAIDAFNASANTHRHRISTYNETVEKTHAAKRKEGTRNPSNCPG